MKQPTKHTRWYHIDATTGKKIIRKFGVNETPPPPWKRGTGPHSPEVRAKLEAHIAKTFKGVPKSAEQRKKMSEAATGKKFSASHRASMRKRWANERKEKKARTQEAFALAAQFGRELNKTQ
jgi:hypothetical protein